MTTGTPLSEPPLVDMMSNDPVLRGVKVCVIIVWLEDYLVHGSHALLSDKTLMTCTGDHTDAY